MISQRAHHSPLEYADDNPVGKAVGILIAEGGSLEEVKAHVASCEVYPDTEVMYTELYQLERASDMTVQELGKLGKSVSR